MKIQSPLATTQLLVSGNTILSGTLDVENNTTIGGDLSVQGNITGSIKVAGDILPTETDQFDLGSEDKRFKDIYLSGSTIFLGNVKLTESEEGTLKVVDANENEVIVGLPGESVGDIDGGFANSIYLISQNIDGGAAIG